MVPTLSLFTCHLIFCNEIHGAKNVFRKWDSACMVWMTWLPIQLVVSKLTDLSLNSCFLSYLVCMCGSHILISHFHSAVFGKCSRDILHWCFRLHDTGFWYLVSITKLSIILKYLLKLCQNLALNITQRINYSRSFHWLSFRKERSLSSGGFL